MVWVWRWLRKKHPGATVTELRRSYYRTNRWWPEDDGVTLFNRKKVAIVRYRYRGAAIPTPWAGTTTEPTQPTRHEVMESRMR